MENKRYLIEYLDQSNLVGNTGIIIDKLYKCVRNVLIIMLEDSLDFYLLVYLNYLIIKHLVWFLVAQFSSHSVKPFLMRNS